MFRPVLKFPEFLTKERIEKPTNFFRRWWRSIFLASIIFDLFIVNKIDEVKNPKLIFTWLCLYSVYFLSTEILRRFWPTYYQNNRFQFAKLQIDILFTYFIQVIDPPFTFNFVWVFYLMPLLAALSYFENNYVGIIIFIEISLFIIVDAITKYGLGIKHTISIIAKCASLGFFSSLSFSVLRLIPQLTIASNLAESSLKLIGELNLKDIVQLLADAAKSGVPYADASVVHMLGGEKRQTLIAEGTSCLDITVLGRSPMVIGQGIAGWALQNRRAVNVPDVRRDDRFTPVPRDVGHIASIIVAPMYVGEKNLGTISVHSGRRNAFDDQDIKYLETLAAQGAMAIANADLYANRKRSRQYLGDILTASLELDPHLPVDEIAKNIALIVCKHSGFRVSLVNLLDEESNELEVKAHSGLPVEGIRKMANRRIPFELVKPLLSDEFMISQSYFIRGSRLRHDPNLDDFTYTLDLGKRKPGEWDAEDMLLVPILVGQDAKLIGYISVDDPEDRQLPSYDTIQILEVLARVAGFAIQNSIFFNQIQAKSEESSRVARLLNLLNRIGAVTQTMTDLDRILHIILTGITDNDGLRFNRACIFVVDPISKVLMGRKGIGQLKEEEAHQRWENMVEDGITFDSFLNGILAGAEIESYPVDTEIKKIKIPIQPTDDDYFSEVIHNSRTRVVYAKDIHKLPVQYQIVMEPTTPTVVVPLVSQNKALGLLICDNKYTNDKVEGNLSLLTNFAVQVAAAIENDMLVNEAKEFSAEVARRDAIRAERARLQDDLHEAMGTLTTGVKWEAEIIQEEINNQNLENANIALRRLLSVFPIAYNSLNCVLEDLRDPTLEQEGLIIALKRRFDDIAIENIEIDDNLEERLPARVEGLLYRVAQEALNNAVKHSGTSADKLKIKVSLRKQNGRVLLSVRDNGLGFNYEETMEKKNKYGLRRIRERVNEAGGEMTVVSHRNWGTDFKVSLPIKVE